MNEIQTPNYTHYSRVETILADEAKWLLASFELRDNNITDPGEYERLEKLATKVLIAAFKANDKNKDKGLGYVDLGEAIRFDEFRQKFGYTFSRIEIQMADFCSWAFKLKYNLPEDLAELARCSGSKLDVKYRVAEGKNNGDITGEKDEPNKGGAHTKYLTEAVEEAYKIFWKSGNTEILRKGKIREFMGRFKGLADEKGNPNFSKYIANRIENVKISPADCTVTTKDHFIESSNSRESIVKGQKYKRARISQILTKLRKKYTITP